MESFQQLAVIAAILVAALVVGWGRSNFKGVTSLSHGLGRRDAIGKASRCAPGPFLFLYAAGLAAYSLTPPCTTHRYP